MSDPRATSDESACNPGVPLLGSPHLIGLALGLSSLALFLTNLDFRTSGDSLVYAAIITKRQFTDVTVHFGYYVLVWALHSAVLVLCRVPVDVFLVYLNAVFGAAGAVVAFWLARELLQSNRLACYCVILLMFSGRYFVNSTSAEMYLPQVFFLLLSYYLFLVKRPITSAVSAAASLLISTLGVFSLLFFPVVWHTKKYPLRHLLVFSACLAVLCGIFFAVVHHELLWGTRGLLRVTASVSPQLLAGGQSYVTYLTKHFGVALLFALLGVFRLPKYPGLLLTAAAVYLPNFYIVFKQPGADHLTMCTDFFLAAICAIGLGTVGSTRAGKYASAVFLAVYVGASGYMLRVYSHSDSWRYRQDMRSLYDQVMKDQDVVVVMSWWDRIAVQYYNTNPVALEWDQNEVAQHVYDEQWLRQSPRRPIRQSARLFVLESYEPSQFAETVLGRQGLQERYEHNSLRCRVERDLGVQCNPAPVGSLQVYRCTNPSPGD